MFGRRYYYKPYRRGDQFGVCGSSSDVDDKPDPQGCPYCAVALYYDQKRDVHWCLRCGYNRPKELDEQQQRQQQNLPNTIKLKPALSDNRDIAAAEPESASAVVSLGTRAEELERRKRYPSQDIMDKDDWKYIKQGYTLVDLREEFHDNHTTISADELNEERERRRRIRGRKGSYNLIYYACTKPK
jgi:hypothetical protein